MEGGEAVAGVVRTRPGEWSVIPHGPTAHGYNGQRWRAKWWGGGFSDSPLRSGCIAGELLRAVDDDLTGGIPNEISTRHEQGGGAPGV